MNWINNLMRPKIRSFLSTKREVPDNLWRTCPVTGQMVFHKDLEANQFVFPGSEYHERMSAQARLTGLFDDGEYERIAVPATAVDPLKFRDSRKYVDRLRDARQNTELDDAVVVGEGQLKGQLVIAAVQDFAFMAGSLGMAAGEALISGMLHAVERKSPFILFAASGGARMQEGIMSLMQMPRTTIAVQRLRDAGLPYLVVLTNPTTGGVTASYAMLGDVHLAEPGALICFAGPRVIQQTIRENLPEGFQRSEYLLEHGMIDMVVHRHQMRDTLASLTGHFMANRQLAGRAADGTSASAVNGSGVARLESGQLDPAADGSKTDRRSANGSKAPKASTGIQSKQAQAPPVGGEDGSEQTCQAANGASSEMTKAGASASQREKDASKRAPSTAEAASKNGKAAKKNSSKSPPA